MSARLNFHPVVPGWLCAAPRHIWPGGPPAPPATHLALFVDEVHLERGQILVMQAAYVCAECRTTMERDLGLGGEHD